MIGFVRGVCLSAYDGSLMVWCVCWVHAYIVPTTASNTIFLCTCVSTYKMQRLSRLIAGSHWVIKAAAKLFLDSKFNCKSSLPNGYGTTKMKTGVIFCCLLAGIVLCIGTATGTGVTLSDCDKSVIIKTHNDIRSDVSPTAANNYG